MKVLLIGAINLSSRPRGGEEYKNRLLLEYLSGHYQYSVVDTYEWKLKPHIFFKLFYYIFISRWDKMIISASSQSVYQLVRLLQYFPGRASKSIYFVIGGYWPSALLSGIFSVKPYEKLESVVVEGYTMKNTLKDAGYAGVVHVVPNFKKFPRYLTRRDDITSICKFVFISRIHPDKGIPEIMEACGLLKAWGLEDFSVTFFGPIDNVHQSEFINSLTSEMNYGGFLNILDDTEIAYRVLSGFDVMLFPTYWMGEGFPGVLVDAFVAGLPVIASNWNMNTELIHHEQNGLIIPPRDSHALALAMKRLMTDKKLRVILSENAQKSAPDYHIDTVWPQIRSIVES